MGAEPKQKIWTFMKMCSLCNVCVNMELKLVNTEGGLL